MSRNQLIISTHDLMFEVAPWPMDEQWMCFRVGTCHGMWRSTAKTYDILAINNDVPGNGHLEDVFEWFEASCIRDEKDLRIMEIWNDSFGVHLQNKRGFIPVFNSLNAVKSWKKMKRLASFQPKVNQVQPDLPHL